MKTFIVTPVYCDICGGQAKYDVKTNAGPWANLCETHARIHARTNPDGSILLGLGIGQELIHTPPF